MKQLVKFSLMIVGISLTLTIACKKEDEVVNIDPPTVKTADVTNITETTAIGGGNVTSEGAAAVTARGVCWSTTQTPTVDDEYVINGNDIGSYTCSLSSLTAYTTYYVRAFASNDNGTNYGAQKSFTTQPDSNTVLIGQLHEGGIVFYIDGTGEHGLIAALTDQGTVRWGCEGTYIYGLSTALGTGQTNTTLIVNYCNTPGIAARVCSDLVLDGYSDWYLPSIDELIRMHENLHSQGLGDFQLSSYWSSSQYNSQTAWYQFFNINGYQAFYDKDYIPYPIRAIRSF